MTRISNTGASGWTLRHYCLDLPLPPHLTLDLSVSTGAQILTKRVVIKFSVQATLIDSPNAQSTVKEQTLWLLNKIHESTVHVRIAVSSEQRDGNEASAHVTTPVPFTSPIDLGQV